MFTDIEASTDMVRRLGDAEFAPLLELHNDRVREALAGHNGIEVATEGDAFFAVFTDAVEAAESAVEVHRLLAAEEWGEGVELKVRIGLHTGNGVLGAENYVGVDVHRAQRIAAAAHGGQTLMSSITAHLVGDRPLGPSTVEEIGKFRLNGFPQPELLYGLGPKGNASAFPPPRGTLSLSRLPSPLTDFVGRETDLQAALDTLAGHRLVTLTGPAGTGKTRLAVEVARRAEAGFDDGAFYVALGSVRDPELIPAAILEVLDLSTAPSVQPVQHLERFLADRMMLLVLDNFEQLLGGTSIVSRLLASAPNLKVLVTSRIPLRIAGERELKVSPLSVAATGVGDGDVAPSVELFASRAAAVRPDFQLSDANLAVVSAITRSLDGLPLAIELAASRMRSLTPELILDRLDNSLLSSASADVPERQRTILGAVGWSYDLLDEPTRSLFEMCSVFVGGFDLAEAEKVCTSTEIDILDGLVNLVESSLLQQTERSGQPRFRMLTVIREYGYAALVARGQEGEAQDRHARAYLALAEAAEREILTSRQGYWLDRLAVDHDNLRAAIDHATRHEDASTALRLTGALWRFWQIRGHLVEGRKRTAAALELRGGDPWGRARALTAFAGILYWQGESVGTLDHSKQALEIFQQLGDEAEISEALYNLSFPYGYAGDVDKANELLNESLEICRRIGRKVGVGRAYWGLGNMAGFVSDWAGLISYSHLAAEEFAALDVPFDLGWAWFMVAHGHLKSDQPEHAEEYLLRALEIFGAVTDLSGLALVFEALAFVALKRGDRSRAARLGGSAHRIRADTGIAITEIEINRFAEIVEFLENRDEATEAAYQEGRGFSTEEAVAHARGEWLV